MFLRVFDEPVKTVCVRLRDRFDISCRMKIFSVCFMTLMGLKERGVFSLRTVVVTDWFQRVKFWNFLWIDFGTGVIPPDCRTAALLPTGYCFSLSVFFLSSVSANSNPADDIRLVEFWQSYFNRPVRSCWMLQSISGHCDMKNFQNITVD